MQFARLNAFGEEVGKPTPKPTSRIGNNNQKQVGILYGHEGGGKVYNYLGGKGLRAGDMVTPEVTHPKSGKTYKTLGRVVSTRSSLGGAAQDTASHLSGNGIMMKTLGTTDQRSLPGFREKEAQAKAEGKTFTTKDWASEAKKKHDGGIMQRLNTMGTVEGGQQ